MELTLDQALQQGVAAHKEGKLQDAERLYRAILQAQPEHPDANHNLGVLAVAMGKPLEALPLFKAALETSPEVEQFWLSYVDSLISVGEFDAAREALENAKQLGFNKESSNALYKRLQTKSSASPSPQQQHLLREHYQAGRLEEALTLAKLMSQKFPAHAFGWQVLGAILYQINRLDESLVATQKSAELAPANATTRYNLGNIFKDLGRLDDAEESYRQAISLQPDHQKAHNNLGAMLGEIGRLDEAKIIYERAISLKPDDYDSQCNLGTTLKKLGNFDEAEDCLRRAIALNPSNGLGHYKLGILLHSLGKFRDAELSYARALNCSSEPSLLVEGIASLLQVFDPTSDLLNPIFRAHCDVKRIAKQAWVGDSISNKVVIDTLNILFSLTDSSNLKIHEGQTQAFRRNAISLNCERHKAIFEEFKIIPEFCFGCFKVEVNASSVLELVKLYVVFSQLELPSNNIRKCMIELRDAVPGFYKGLIYCSSSQEAFDIAGVVSRQLVRRLGTELPVLVKRGCSEYAIEFPDYKTVSDSGDLAMDYNPNWRGIEAEFDARSGEAAQLRSETLEGMGLLDVLIIRNWLDYAKGVGDDSLRGSIDLPLGSQLLYDAARRRIQTHPFS